MKMRWFIFLLLAFGGLAALSMLAKAQSLGDSGGSSSAAVSLVSAAAPLPDLTYMRPTEKTMLRNYAFDAFGPYPIVGAGLAGEGPRDQVGQMGIADADRVRVAEGDASRL